MGFRADLPDGTRCMPAVEVLSKRLTIKQANDQFRGLRGVCPDCQKQVLDHQLDDTPSVRAGLAATNLDVGYVCGSEQRLMHWRHIQRSLNQCRVCSDPSLAQHAAALEVIAEWARKEWPDCRVEVELTVVIPGTPPERFEPDIGIYESSTGKPVACIEYERKVDSIPLFKRRVEVREKQFPDIRFYFESGPYGRAREHRLLLAERGHRVWRTWVDKESGALEGEEGGPPKQRTQLITQKTPHACQSKQSLISRADEQGHHIPRTHQNTINTTLPFRVTDRKKQHSLPFAVLRAVAENPDAHPTQIANRLMTQHSINIDGRRVLEIKRGVQDVIAQVPPGYGNAVLVQAQLKAAGYAFNLQQVKGLLLQGVG